MKQVKTLIDRLWDWAEPRLYGDALGYEATSLKAETAFIETLCMETGIRLMYRTLEPDSWDRILA